MPVPCFILKTDDFSHRSLDWYSLADMEISDDNNVNDIPNNYELLKIHNFTFRDT